MLFIRALAFGFGLIAKRPRCDAAALEGFSLLTLLGWVENGAGICDCAIPTAQAARTSNSAASRVIWRALGLRAALSGTSGRPLPIGLEMRVSVLIPFETKKTLAISRPLSLRPRRAA
jgi:hypothetical protein